ncbi:unnamed protein product [Hermetia illucens]|uniref:Uncharacterized protein n=2 Tax=Hermetia illucens TaxID=343691 RepID=A0A7R8V0L4_HERIL|nr:unnamed protein product [Hermetia illucens]
MSLGLFNTKSTYQDDFIVHPIRPLSMKSKPKFDDPQRKMELGAVVQKDVSTMKNFHPDVYVPFDLFFRPKGCVTTNPFKEVTYKRKDKSNEFAERLQARKTRPRIFMIPQISLDDVDQDLMYRKGGLVDNIYTSNWKISTEFVHDGSNKNVIDVPPNYKPKEVGFHTKQFCTEIEPGMQKYSDEWDSYQLRAATDPTELFWTKHDQLGTCSICKPKDEEKLTEKESAEITECLASDSLRLPYQLKMPGYGGYVPEIPTNVKPRKTMFSRTEPWLSTTMEAQGVYKKI